MQEYYQLITAFNEKIESWKNQYPELSDFKKTLQSKINYQVENILVFNKDLKAIKNPEAIRYILVADNPGKDEQLDINQRYLVGTAGKIARNFFLRNKLVKDFSEEVIILNKTPIHTPKTGDLAELKKNDNLHNLLRETEEYMASLLIKLQNLLMCDIWLIGLSELKKGIFKSFRQTISFELETNETFQNHLYCFMHFSMGSFSKNYKKLAKSELSLEENLSYIGTQNRKKIFSN